MVNLFVLILIINVDNKYIVDQDEYCGKVGFRLYINFIPVVSAAGIHTTTIAFLSGCKRQPKGMERGVWEAPPLYLSYIKMCQLNKHYTRYTVTYGE